MSRILLGVGMALIAAAMAGRAHAGAWLAPKNGQETWTTAAGMRDDVQTTEVSAYWEQPLNSDHSLVAVPWAEFANDVEEGWRSEALIGVKRAIFRDGPNVMAVQAGALWRSDAPEGCSGGGAELRWLGGRALGDEGFINLEVAGRALAGGCTGARIDLAAGWRPQENWLALGEIFFDAPSEGEQSLKVQFSLARFDRSGRAVQLGLRTSLDGEPQEIALVLGFWDTVGD